MNRRGAVVGGPEAPFTLRMVPYVDAFCTHDRGCKATHVAVRRRRTLQMLRLYANYHYLLRHQCNATTDGNATYNDAVYVIAAVEIDYNVAVLV